MGTARTDKLDGERRTRLLAELRGLVTVAIFGTASATFRRCGTAGCRCQTDGPKHGPHIYVSYRDRAAGKTTGYYVPQAAQADVLKGIQAWQRLQACVRELAEQNRERVLTTAQGRGRRSAPRRGSR